MPTVFMLVEVRKFWIPLGKAASLLESRVVTTYEVPSPKEEE